MVPEQNLEPPACSSRPLLQVRGLCKSFGPTKALDGVELSTSGGEVHAVLGENGAGKSTLMKILAGALRPDAGELRLGGEHFAPADPIAARHAGVAMVYQEPQLCPHLTVAENVLLGVEPTRWGLLQPRQVNSRTRQALETVVEPDRLSVIVPNRLVGTLAPPDQQLVAIARALAQADCRVLILDEPTSSLGVADVQRLFTTVRRLRERGLSILYISHFLEEVQQIADRYTVLRDGRSVGQGKVAQTPLSDIVHQMVGRQVEQRFERSQRRAGEVVVELEQLAGKSKPRDCTLQLHRGEVVGVAGLVGAGRTELLRIIFGLDPVRCGQIRVGSYVGPASPLRRLAQGVGLVSEDRKEEGLALGLSVADNLTLSKLRGLGPGFIVLPRIQKQQATHWIEQLDIRCRSADQPVADLSGGNQQKVALARLLYHDVDVYLLDEPTRGIDVASRAAIYRLIDELAGRGSAVLMVSSYLPELLGVCDRIAVMRRGTLGRAKPVRELDQHTVMTEAAGA